MPHTYYETDDETNIYIEDDPNYDPDAVPPPPSMTSPAGMKLLLVDDSVLNYDDDDIISEIMDSYINTTTIEHGDDSHNATTIIPPHEDPITELGSPEMERHTKKVDAINATTSVVSNEASDHADRRTMMGLSKCIKKWGICWMVTLIVAITITGAVFMFRQYGIAHKSSTSSNEDNYVGGEISFKFPSTSPSMTPSSSPTFIPTSYPSVAPSVTKDTVNNGGTTTMTNAPTDTPITAIPTANPTTATPSNSPSTELYSQIIYLLRESSTTPHQFNDFTTYESRAAQWVKYNSTIDLMSNQKIIQRYTMALLDLAMHSKFTMALPSIDECEWFGVTCTSSTSSDTTTSAATSTGTSTALFEPVTSIVWNNQNMTSAQIPNDIALLSNSLIHLDLSENPNIEGTIPYGLYSCTQLEYLYLYSMQLSGSIRTEIGQLSTLKKLFLGSNAFTGSIPVELGISSLEWLSLYKNDFTGSIPTMLGWTNMIYLDLGQNQLTGTIPNDWVDVNSNTTSMMVLNALYLDYNMLNGTLPATMFTLGDSTIEQIVINDNLLTGEIPSTRQYPNYNLTTFKMQNNLFTRVDKEFCRQQSIYEGTGMLSIFTADCDICTCNDLCATYCSQ